MGVGDGGWMSVLAQEVFKKRPRQESLVFGGSCVHYEVLYHTLQSVGFGVPAF